MPIEEQTPLPLSPPSGEPPYITPEEARNITLGMHLTLRRSWPDEGNVGLGPEVEVIGISNGGHSQTGRLLLLRYKRDRIQLLDAGWCNPDPRLDPFYTP
jgi:hypothetical protein